MADDEALQNFDLTKKKKKKKKVEFDDATEQPKPEVTEEPSVPASEEKEETSAAVDEPLDDDFSSLKKKKKKSKSKPFDMSELGDALPSEKSAEDRVSPTLDDDDFSKMPKKKKKKRRVEEDDGSAARDDEVDGGKLIEEGSIWSSTSEKDYTYEELLQRAFDIMRERNPDLVAGEKKKFVMKPPQVMKVGAKKTSFANFAEICKLLHRQPKHLLAFLFAELGTSGSLDGNNQLIIKGKFQQKQIETVLRRYIKEYVTCHTCRSPDTILQKDTRLFFLQCESCGSRCSVTSIKSGFQAVTGRRAAMRARNT